MKRNKNFSKYSPLNHLPTNPIGTLETDVLIIGSGPIGATYARKILDESNSKVLMIDIGAFGSTVPGEHLKNSSVFQKDVDPFSNIIRGHWHNLSTPVNKAPTPTLGPGAFRIPADRYGTYRLKNQNPKQKDDDNMPSAGATYMVGGMGTHWTAACPRMNPTVELSNLIPLEEWDELYNEAEKLFNVSTNVFNHSIRHNLVKEILRETYASEISDKRYWPNSLPLAARRRIRNSEFVEWSSSATILGNYARDPNVIYRASNPSLACSMEKNRFRIMEQHICRKLVRCKDGSRVEYAIVENLLHKRSIAVKAKIVVVCCGTVLGAQLLYASDIRPPSLGKYLSEQPMAFCQIVLNQDTINRLTATNSEFAKTIKEYQKKNPNDPIPIPMSDPDPQCYIPVSEKRPWHCQIHRDAFSYGDVAPNVDPRLIVDFRWFGIVKQLPTNQVTFNEEDKDFLGMPQPTFHYRIDSEDGKTLNLMMQDMLKAATAMGSFLPGSNPQFMPIGLSAHVNGVTRMGKSEQDSVVDVNCKVWNVDNCFIGGLGILPKAAACNQTLTSAALAIRTVNYMLKMSMLLPKQADLDIVAQLTYNPSFERINLEKCFNDDYYICSADINCNGYPDIICYGLNVAEIRWFENPNTEADAARIEASYSSNRNYNINIGANIAPPYEGYEMWKSHLITKFNKPDSMDTGDINQNGYQDIVIRSDEGGLIHWLENPGKHSEWKTYYIGRAIGKHRLILGKFTQMERIEILALFLGSDNRSDTDSVCKVKLFRSPPLGQLHKEKEWEEVLIDNEYFHGIHDVEKQTYRQEYYGDSLDSILVFSQEGITFMHYSIEEKKFLKKNLIKGISDQSSQNVCSGNGCMTTGRHGDDPFAYIATIEPFCRNAIIVYVRDETSALIGDLWNSKFKCYVLDIYGDTNDKSKDLVHCIIGKDFDCDGNDEFLLALQSDSHNKGIFYYKPMDLSRGLFTKYHLSTDSAACIAVADFNKNGQLDYATVDYLDKDCHEMNPCELNVYYNSLNVPKCQRKFPTQVGILKKENKRKGRTNKKIF